MSHHRKKVIFHHVGLVMMLLKTSEIFPSVLWLIRPFYACGRSPPAIFHLRVVRFIYLSLRSGESGRKDALEADSVLHAEEQYKNG